MACTRHGGSRTRSSVWNGGSSGPLTGPFYADDGKITSCDAEWLQTLTDILTGLFLRVGFRTNTTKTKTMTCVPGALQTLILEATYKCQSTGQGDSHHQRKRHCILCPECDKELAAVSLRQHLRVQHGLDPPTFELPDNILDAHQPHQYVVSFPRIRVNKPCLVPGFTAKPTSWHSL